jgi:hypothetical protein
MKIETIDVVKNSLEFALSILKDHSTQFSNSDEVKNIFIEAIQ